MAKTAATARFIYSLIVLIVGILIGAILATEYVKQRLGPQRISPAAVVDTVRIVDQSSHSQDGGKNLSDVISDHRTSAIVQATQRVAPSVVGVVVTQIQVLQNSYGYNDFFDLFFGPRHRLPKVREVESIGSGFIIRKDGYILTNYHVVQGAAKLHVNFADGSQREGSVVGFDSQTDLAVIKVETGNLNAARLGNSDKLMIGEWAIAIGNPFLNFIGDAHPTVTVGVVSALNRNFAPSEGVYYQSMIQTDAAINPGNSGGPLVNAHGEIIAINTFIYTGSAQNRGSIGIGFAIPINRASRIANELISFGTRRQVWTGLTVQNLNRSIALSLGYDKTDGVVVVDVAPDSPAAAAQVQPGDIIIALGNRRIQTTEDTDGFFLDYLVGDTIAVSYIRKGKKGQTKLILKQFPKR